MPGCWRTWGICWEGDRGCPLWQPLSTVSLIFVYPPTRWHFKRADTLSIYVSIHILFLCIFVSPDKIQFTPNALTMHLQCSPGTVLAGEGLWLSSAFWWGSCRCSDCVHEALGRLCCQPAVWPQVSHSSSLQFTLWQ